MKIRIVNWGRSLAIPLPRKIVETSGLTEGAEVTLQIKDDHIDIRPLRQRVYSLAELLKDVRRSNIHPEIDGGPPRGREVL